MSNKELEEKIVAETRLLVDLFLKTNLSDEELSNRSDINLSRATIGRRLTNKEMILKAYPNGEEVYEQVMNNRRNNLIAGKILGSQTTLINNNSNNIKLRIDIFYKDLVKQAQLLLHIALTYRLKLNNLYELFGIEDNSALDLKIKEILKYNSGFRNATQFLNNRDFMDQEVAKKRVVEFYIDYINAKRSKNSELIRNVINRVTDAKMNYLIKNIDRNHITDEQIGIIIDYLLKYAVDNTLIARMLDVNRANLMKRFNLYVADNLELKNRYEFLADYNNPINKEKNYEKR